MKKLFFLLLLISSRALSQEDTTRYLKYPGAYGSQYTRGWFTKSFRVPFIDTVAINALPGALQSGLDGNPYWWNGVKWGRLGGTGDLSAYIKFADSLTKYITPAQLSSYNYLSGISGIAAGGDLTGTYPNPAVSLFNGYLPSYYLDRANHTGKQPYTTITGLATVASTGYYTDLTGAPAALPTTSGLDDVLANNNSSSKNIHAFDIYASDGFVSNNYYTPSFGVRLYDGALDVGSNFNLGSTHSGYITGYTYRPATGSIVYYGPQIISATNGNGYTLYNPQVSSPGAPVSGFILYAKSTGALAWKGVNGYQRSFPAGSLTADRDYTLPDASGTLALTASTLAGYGIADAIKNTTSIQAGANIAIDGSIGLGAAVRAGNQLDIQNSNAGMSINTSDASNAANIYINRSTGTPAVPTIPSSALSIGSLQFNTYSGTGALTTYTNSAVIQAGMDATPSTTSTPGYLAFKTTPAGSLATVERMRINSGGNIGVGTISPAYKLDVQGTSATSAISSDIGYNINPVAMPAAPSLATIAASGNLGIGVYRYTISITTALGETNSPQTVTVTTASGNQQVLVSWGCVNWITGLQAIKYTVPQ